MNKRFLLLILGTAVDIDKDLNHIADGEHGVNFVDGKGMFICTFYSPYSTSEIHEKLAHRPAMMLFDITSNESYGVNLPTKYYGGIFPEVQKELDIMMEIQKEMMEKDPNVIYDETNGNTFTRVNRRKENPEPKVEEYDNVNDILDKLSRNSYNRECLTSKEIEILNKG